MIFQRFSVAKSEIIFFYSRTCRVACVRCVRTTPVAFGLEEFFPPGVIEKGELAPESVNTGTF